MHLIYHGLYLCMVTFILLHVVILLSNSDELPKIAKALSPYKQKLSNTHIFCILRDIASIYENSTEYTKT